MYRFLTLDDRAEGRLEITTPKDPISSQVFDIIFAAEKRRYRTIVKMNAIPFRGFGIYHFVISMKLQGADDWEEVANLPLEMRKGPNPQPS